MNNFSKMLVGSSLVLGAVLFSVGCGGDSFCCKDGEPPIPKIVGDAKTISLENTTKHTFNGLTTNGMDDGTIVKCKWYIDGKLQSYTGDACSNVELNFAGMSGRPEVCLEVIDNEGLSSTLNNGKIEKDEVGASANTPKNSPIELRKKMDCKYVAITSIAGPDPKAKISIANATFMSGCPIATAADAGSTPGEGTITNYAWKLDGIDINSGANDTSLKYSDMDGLSIGSHKVCLTVTNSLGSQSKESCETITVKEHEKPKADIKVFEGGDFSTSLTTLPADKTVFLSCEDSKNDCPKDNSHLECKWEAKSWYQEDDGSCATAPGSKGYKFEDCFNEHKGHGSNITLPTERSSQYVCAPQLCIQIGLTVTDKRSGKSDYTSKTYKSE